MEELLERFKGGAVGAAIGAALGKSVEMVPLSEALDYYGRVIADLEKPHPSSPYDYLKPEEVPASVELFRLALESLVESKGFDPYDFAARVAQWVGSTEVHKYLEPSILATAKAILTEEPLSEVVRKTFSVDAVLHTSAMGFFHFDNPVLAAEGAKVMASVFSEGNDVLEGAQILGAAVSMLLSGEYDLTLFEERLRFVDELIENCPELGRGKVFLLKVKERLSENLKPEEAIRVFGNGEYVFEALPLALYLFLRDVQYPQRAFLNAVNACGGAGGATSALGFMVGQWIGAYWGIEVFPEGWRKRVQHAGVLEGLAEKLYRLLFE